MANGYSQIFTLEELFNNSQMRRVLPQVNYKEKTTPSGKLSQRTNLRTANRIVFDTAENNARPYYSQMLAHRQGDTITINGVMKGDINSCVDRVYNAMKALKLKLEFTANDMNLIRETIKTLNKGKNGIGEEPRLFLRAESLMQIKAMKPNQLRELLNNVMENIYFNPAFSEVQEKLKLNERLGIDYENMKEDFNRRVGNI